MKSKCKEDHCMQTAMIFFVFSSSSPSCYIISLWNLFWVMRILIWMRQDQLPEIRFPKTVKYLNTTTCIIVLTAPWQSINDIQIQYSTWEQAVWANEWNVPAANLVMPLSFRVSTQQGKYLSDKWFFLNSSNSPFFVSIYLLNINKKVTPFIKTNDWWSVGVLHWGFSSF